MNDFVVKTCLVASIILMGYNVSEFFSSYNAISKKVEEVLELAKLSSASDNALRRTNFIPSFIMNCCYVALVYFSGVVVWLVSLLAVKIFVSLYISDKVLMQIFRDRSISQKSYLVSKWDSFFNATMGFAFALILVV